MSGKSKKTAATVEKTNPQNPDIFSVSLASTKAIKKLSLSFYGDDTMKQQKQFIFDTYEERQPKSTKKSMQKNRSQTAKKSIKPKTPIPRMKI